MPNAPREMSGALVIASIISKGVLYIWQLVLSTWLGPTEYGIYGTVGGLMVNAATIASFGMGLIVIRDVARDPSKAGKCWSAMLFVQTILAVLAYIGMNGVAVGYSETLRAFAASGRHQPLHRSLRQHGLRPADCPGSNG